MLTVQKRQALKIRSCSNQIIELNAQISDMRRHLDESNSSKQSLEQFATVVGERNVLTATQRTLKPCATVSVGTEDNKDDIKNMLKRCAGDDTERMPSTRFTIKSGETVTVKTENSADDTKYLLRRCAKDDNDTELMASTQGNITAGEITGSKDDTKYDLKRHSDSGDELLIKKEKQ